MEIHTSIVIDAPAFSVWNLLTDLASYSRWNPFITKIKGELKQGGRLDMEMKLDKVVAIDPVVQDVQLERQISWLDKSTGSLFVAEHRLEIQTLAHDRVTFFQIASFTGPIVSLVEKRLETGFRKGLEEMNAALKKVAEQSWIGSTGQPVLAGKN
ncbi:MAG: SRPBCC family protein [Nitrososphaera sp.]|uniref:SRPBCC family protein n=1 Tax=Nitrososphaera sp. TaxID=1971748 RepID=UPI003D6DDF90